MISLLDAHAMFLLSFVFFGSLGVCVGQDQCSANLQSICSPCLVQQASYNCSLPGLQDFVPGQYEGIKANYLSFATERSSPSLKVRAEEFRACTGGIVSFSEAQNVWEDPVKDLGTKTSRGSELYDGYFMSYSHFPEVSALGLAEPLNERIRRDNDKLKWEDVLSQVKRMGEYRKNGTTDIDFLMYDGDFFVPMIRIDLLEQHDLPLPNTWNEVVDMAKFFHNQDLNEDGIPDFGFCHFPRIGAGHWDWWFAESVYSTWATYRQTHGIQQGFFFDDETMEPQLGEGFQEAVRIWKELWANGGPSGANFNEGRCAIGYGPPGEWKGVLLDPNGLSRKDSNGNVVWRASLKDGTYAEPYRFRPFGSLEVEDTTTGKLVPCTPELCPKAELVPAYGHYGIDDRVNQFVKAAPSEGRLINRVPFYWSGGLGTLIRRSAKQEHKDLLWDFFVYTNSPTTSVYDVSNYESWLDSWRYSHLNAQETFATAGWSETAYKEHSQVAHWALGDSANGAFNIRLPGIIKYTRDVMGEQMLKYIANETTIVSLVNAVEIGWKEVTAEEGLLDQLDIYRSSLGLDSLSEVSLCRIHRALMDERDPSVCVKYDPAESQDKFLILIVVLSIVVLIGLVVFGLIIVKRRKDGIMAWHIRKDELLFGDPPEALGRGTFGLVVLAEYRGTQVAVKRVIPPRNRPPMRSGPSECNDLESQSYDDSILSFSEAHSLSNDVERPVIREKRNATNLTVSSFASGSGSKSYDHSKLKTEFLEEMIQLSKLRHPCITTIMGAVVGGKEEDPMLVMEYMDHGSLYDMLHNETIHFDGDILLPILRDIVKGVRFLHSADPPFVHSDLKASNILVDSRFRAKVSDFGLSQKGKVGAVGTPFWLAPELVRNETGNTVESDAYAFGMIIWEVYSRADPFAEENSSVVDILQMVADPKVKKRPVVPDSCPPKAAAIMSDCWENDPSRRPTFAELDLQLNRLDAIAVEPLGAEKKGRDKDRANNLLFEVFPRHIAEALRDGRKVEPQSRDIVTICFTDIVGFTALSAQLSPMKVSDILGRLYDRFDELARLHKVYKVETIGDSYMAVTNLTEDQPDHVKRIAEFAIAVVNAANDILIDTDHPEKGTVAIRAGFHSGPVVANVVGSLNPRYCLFGDVVNTSSRMESTSKRNRIQCSDRSAALLREQCPSIKLISRGVVPIKGKGEMETYWIKEAPRVAGVSDLAYFK